MAYRHSTRAAPGARGRGTIPGRNTLAGRTAQTRTARRRQEHYVTKATLWRDELASCSFASRSVPELIAAARHAGATQFACYLLLHVWISAFGDSADAMRAPRCWPWRPRRPVSHWSALLRGLTIFLLTRTR